MRPEAPLAFYPCPGPEAQGQPEAVALSLRPFDHAHGQRRTAAGSGAGDHLAGQGRVAWRGVHMQHTRAPTRADLRAGGAAGRRADETAERTAQTRLLHVGRRRLRARSRLFRHVGLGSEFRRRV